jgi:hypothetical protein
MAGKKRKNQRRRHPKERCIYCGKPAGTKEHIIATRFIDVLRADPRGLKLPIVLKVTLAGGGVRNIGGKRLAAGRYTLEYTTRVCDQCNSGWMNDVDTKAFPYVAEMIRGKPLALDPAAQAAVAAWFCKVAVTARSEPHNRLPIEREWTEWLYAQHSAVPGWHVWIGHYIGEAPWWYNPHDIRIELGAGSAAPPPGFVRQNGVLATLVIGYLALQVFGLGGPGAFLDPDREPVFPMIWPVGAETLMWPPPGHIDDAGLPLWAERLLHVPSPQPAKSDAPA